jgi:hypothetical protein
MDLKVVGLEAVDWTRLADAEKPLKDFWEYCEERPG